jgi:hypothetical protein
MRHRLLLFRLLLCGDGLFVLAVNAHAEFFRPLQRQLKRGTLLGVYHLEQQSVAKRYRDSVTLLAHELIQNLLLLVVLLKLG